MLPKPRWAGDLLMFVTAPQNLYRNDEHSFRVELDSRCVAREKRRPDRVDSIPGSAHADPRLAINELEQYVASTVRSQLKLPPFLSDNVQVVRSTQAWT